jgi:hypothetical protein
MKTCVHKRIAISRTLFGTSPIHLFISLPDFMRARLIVFVNAFLLSVRDSSATEKANAFAHFPAFWIMEPASLVVQLTKPLTLIAAKLMIPPRFALIHPSIVQLLSKLTILPC